MEKCERSERLRVCIIRQVTVQLNSKKQIKNYIVAEGSMKADPPDPSDCYCYPMRNSELKYLSWTGSLKVNKDVKTGGFEGEYIKVSDFVALIIGKSVVPWPDVRCSVGIKLVRCLGGPSRGANHHLGFVAGVVRRWTHSVFRCSFRIYTRLLRYPS